MSRKKLSVLNNFSKRIDFLIKSELKIKQKQFANNIGISEQYLSMILNQGTGPSAEMIAGIFLHYAEYLRWLVTGEEPIRADACRNNVLVMEDSPEYTASGGKLAEILRMTREIMESKTVYSEALHANVLAFHRAAVQEKLIANTRAISGRTAIESLVVKVDRIDRELTDLKKRTSVPGTEPGHMDVAPGRSTEGDTGTGGI